MSRLRIGLFGANCAGGLAVTTVPERWLATWPENIALARLADASGIDVLIPIARWIGYGGETRFQEHSLETITWAAGLLAATERIVVLATTHAAFVHPLVAAKQFATVEAMAPGRFGINVVCGCNAPEYRMMGLEPELPIARRVLQPSSRQRDGSGRQRGLLERRTCVRRAQRRHALDLAARYRERGTDRS